MKEFKVDDTSLMLELYPNGEDQNDVNHVSLYIENCSEVDIDILFDLNMGRKVKRTDVTFSIKAGDSWGYGDFYDHDDEKLWNDGDEAYGTSDSDFEITLTVKKLWKQFHEDRVNSNMSKNFMSVEQRLASLENSVKSLVSIRR